MIKRTGRTNFTPHDESIDHMHKLAPFVYTTQNDLRFIIRTSIRTTIVKCEISTRNTTSTSIDTTTRIRVSPPFLPNVLLPDAFSAHVTSVSLGNTDIPVQPILTEYLGRCSALRVLYLGANALGDRGIITFVTTVSPRILQQLTVLDLRYNDITAGE